MLSSQLRPSQVGKTLPFVLLPWIGCKTLSTTFSCFRYSQRGNKYLVFTRLKVWWCFLSSEDMGLCALLGRKDNTGVLQEVRVYFIFDFFNHNSLTRMLSQHFVGNKEHRKNEFCRVVHKPGPQFIFYGRDISTLIPKWVVHTCGSRVGTRATLPTCLW